MNDKSQIKSKEDFFNILEEVNTRSKLRTEELKKIIDEAEKEINTRRSLGEDI